MDPVKGTAVPKPTHWKATGRGHPSAPFRSWVLAFFDFGRAKLESCGHKWTERAHLLVYDLAITARPWQLPGD